VGARFRGVPGATLRDRNPASVRCVREPKAAAESAPGPATWLTNRSESDCSPRAGPAAPSRFTLGLRFAASPSDGPFSALEACSAGLASAPHAPGRRRRLRRLQGSSDRRHQPGGRPSLDSLARTGHPGDARDGQCLLHGVSLHAATDTCAALAAPGPELAALVAEQVAGSGLARLVSLGLRGAGPLGQPVVDGLAHPGLLHVGRRDRRFLSRCIVLQVCLSDRPVQLRAVAGFAPGSEDSPGESVYGLSNQRMHPRRRRRCRLRAGPVPATEGEQYGLHLLPGLYPCLSS
jgi:hypothetical protein